MKTFHMYKQRRLGSSLYRTENTDELLVAQQTLTVGELKEALASYPDDTPVFAEWEGQTVDILMDRIKVEERIDFGVASESCDILTINVDTN